MQGYLVNRNQPNLRRQKRKQIKCNTTFTGELTLMMIFKLWISECLTFHCLLRNMLLSNKAINHTNHKHKRVIHEWWPLNVLVQGQSVFKQASSSYWFAFWRHETKARPRKKVTWQVIRDTDYFCCALPLLMSAYASVNHLRWRNDPLSLVYITVAQTCYITINVSWLFLSFSE